MSAYRKVPTVRLRLLFEPRDLWVGVYWNLRRTTPSTIVGVRWLLEIYLCVVPMFPLLLTIATYKWPVTEEEK